MKKYKLTKETRVFYGTKLYRIEALKDFSDVKKGDKGGFIEKEENLSQNGNAYVSGNARVSGNAYVYGDAYVYGNAHVYGDAHVSGNAYVYEKLKLIGGYFYHTKQKSETIEKIEMGDDYELLCSKPELEKEEEVSIGKKVKIKVADGQILEGEIVE